VPPVLPPASAQLISVPGISAPHVLGQWLKDPIGVERFNCKGDFNGSTGFDNQKTLAEAIGSGEKLVFAPGKAYLTGVPLVATNRALGMEGTYGASAIVMPAGVPGMVVSQDTYSHATNIRNLNFLTLGTETAQKSALTVQYAVDDSGNFRNHERCSLEGIVVGGVDYLQHGWDVGIDTIDVHNLSLRYPFIRGRRNFADYGGGRLSFATMTAGIRNTGTSESSRPSDALVERPYVFNAKTAIQSRGEVEGFAVENPILVAVLVGFDIQNSSARPWGSISGGHISALDVMISAKNCPSFMARDILFYKGAPAGVMPAGMYPTDIVPGPAGTVVVYLEACPGFDLSGLKAINNAADYASGGAHIGVVLKDCLAGDIREFRHNKPTVSVYEIGTSGGNITSNLRTQGTYTGSPVAEYVDRSTGGGNERTDGNRPVGTVTNAAPITVGTTPDQTVLVFVPMAQVGQRYRVDVQVEAGLTTAGEVNFSLSNAGGSASGAWAASAGYVPDRGQSAAGTRGSTMSGTYTVSARGSLALRLSLQMLSGAATVGAGKAQMTVTLL
jgi:hypothetical protein